MGIVGEPDRTDGRYDWPLKNIFQPDTVLILLILLNLLYRDPNVLRMAAVVAPALAAVTAGGKGLSDAVMRRSGLAWTVGVFSMLLTALAAWGFITTFGGRLMIWSLICLFLANLLARPLTIAGHIAAGLGRTIVGLALIGSAFLGPQGILVHVVALLVLLETAMGIAGGLWTLRRRGRADLPDQEHAPI